MKENKEGRNFVAYNNVRDYFSFLLFFFVFCAYTRGEQIEGGPEITIIMIIKLVV